MTVADILQYLLLIVGSWLTLVAYWLATVALTPRLVERCAARNGGHPVRDTLVGLVIALPLAVLGLVAAKQLGEVAVPVVLGCWLLAVMGALVGAAGLAQRIGAGLTSPLDAAQPWRRMLRGGMVLGLVFFLPLLGWYVLLPWALVSGLGALVGSLGAQRQPRAPLSHDDASDGATVATAIERVR